jgi:hypothetical protein
VRVLRLTVEPRPAGDALRNIEPRPAGDAPHNIEPRARGDGPRTRGDGPRTRGDGPRAVEARRAGDAPRAVGPRPTGSALSATEPNPARELPGTHDRAGAGSAGRQLDGSEPGTGKGHDQARKASVCHEEVGTPTEHRDGDVVARHGGRNRQQVPDLLRFEE